MSGIGIHADLAPKHQKAREHPAKDDAKLRHHRFTGNHDTRSQHGKNGTRDIRT